ncbi:MAG: M15 family metallopeptidase, partial [Pseudomonadota bacterium]
ANINMNPDFVVLVNGLIAGLRGDGHDVRVIAGFRSFADQQERFERGRLKSGPIITEAAPGHSWHNYGLAVDIILNDDQGDPAWPEVSSPFWQCLAEAALARGAVWGGHFGFPAHIEYHPALARKDAGSLIEDFECFGLEMVWSRALNPIAPVDDEETRRSKP